MKSDGRMRGFTLIVRWVMAKLQSLWSESETWGGLNREREREKTKKKEEEEKKKKKKEEEEKKEWPKESKRKGGMINGYCKCSGGTNRIC